MIRSNNKYKKDCRGFLYSPFFVGITDINT